MNLARIAAFFVNIVRQGAYSHDPAFLGRFEYCEYWEMIDILIMAELSTGLHMEDLITALFIFCYLELIGDFLVKVGEVLIFAITGEKITSFRLRRQFGQELPGLLDAGHRRVRVRIMDLVGTTLRGNHGGWSCLPNASRPIAMPWNPSWPAWSRGAISCRPASQTLYTRSFVTI